ncbi:MAG: response regulator transcription factor [Sneathiella sp.]
MSDLILIVDDDEELLNTMSFLLKEVGYSVCVARNRSEMLSSLKVGNVDLIFLDINLGSENGLELALEVRTTSIVPIIILSGEGSLTNKVTGLELGADDYITKPYSATELLARTKAALRRFKMVPKTTIIDDSQLACFDDWVCDVRKRNLLSTDNQEVKLTPGEFSLLLVFLLSKNEVVSRHELLMSIGLDANFDRSIDVQILRLRRKLAKGNKSYQPIQSVRSVGYIFTPKVAWKQN